DFTNSICLRSTSLRSAFTTGPSTSLGSIEGKTSRTVADRFTATGAWSPSEFPSFTSACNTQKSAPAVELWKGHLNSTDNGRPVRVTYIAGFSFIFQACPAEMEYEFYMDCADNRTLVSTKKSRPLDCTRLSALPQVVFRWDGRVGEPKSTVYPLPQPPSSDQSWR